MTNEAVSSAWPTMPDWLTLWARLSDMQERHWERVRTPSDDFWAKRARQFDKKVRDMWGGAMDSSRRFLHDWFIERPGCSVLDIGAGTGRWAEFLSPLTSRVTAVEPSEAMLEVLHENIESLNLRNVETIPEFWPLGTDPEPHDLVFAAHAVYGVADLRTFVEAMERAARQACVLMLRAPLPDGLAAQACQLILGQPYDAPTFEVGYNCLLQMGIQADVQIEDTGLWKPSASDSLDEAVHEMKSRMDVLDRSDVDEPLRTLMDACLTRRDGKLIWPQDTRSALIYWDRERFSIHRKSQR